jgi:anti-sigma-K factor RskA
MYDDDRDALAAEYVLGTLSAEEREQAEALLAIDHGFAQTVRLWEHRLGELNVMVEAVEPPADVWERIKNDIDGAGRQGSADAIVDAKEEIDSLKLEGSPPTSAVSDEQSSAETFTDNLTPAADIAADRAVDTGHDPTVAALASSLLPPDAAAEFDKRPPKSAAAIAQTSSSDEVIRSRLQRWRSLGIAASIVAALLAAYVAAAQFIPGLTTAGRQSQPAVATPKRPAQLVAVLQQEPTAPAFLVMLDPLERTITVRRLTTAPDSGRSYELWLYSAKSPKPVSLGLVGTAEVTNRPVPANLDLETMGAAGYSVSLEPASGSPSGAPSGPILFKGRMIEASPAGPG